MTIKAQAHCDGPGCEKKVDLKITTTYQGEAKFKALRGWILGYWGDWCSRKCFDKWEEEDRNK